MRIILIATILFFTIPAYAADKWSKRDIWLESAFIGLKLIDWNQTMQAADHWDEYQECNPILGESPSKSSITLFTAGVIIMHALVTHFMPAEYRPHWQVPGVIIGAVVVYHNSTVLGLSIRF